MRPEGTGRLLNHKVCDTSSITVANVLISTDGKKVSYFRGRKLHGRRVKVPEGYKGVILSSTDRKLPKDPQTMDEDEADEAEEPLEVGVIAEQSQFDELMIWGHEVVPDETADPYIRAVEEWISLAEQVLLQIKCQYHH
jgi:ribonuclease H2 subunit C